MQSPSIAVPPGSGVVLNFVRPWSWVGVTPPGAMEAWDAIVRPGGLFEITSDDARTSWPDHAGCRVASALLAAGEPVLLSFETYADASAARNRLMEEGRQQPPNVRAGADDSAALQLVDFIRPITPRQS